MYFLGVPLPATTVHAFKETTKYSTSCRCFLSSRRNYLWATKDLYIRPRTYIYVQQPRKNMLGIKGVFGKVTRKWLLRFFKNNLKSTAEMFVENRDIKTYFLTLSCFIKEKNVTYTKEYEINCHPSKQMHTQNCNNSTFLFVLKFNVFFSFHLPRACKLFCCSIRISIYTSATRVFEKLCNMDVYIRPWLLVLQLDIISIISKGL